MAEVYAAVSPKRDGYLNNISIEDEEIIGHTEDGQPIYAAPDRRKRPSLQDEAVDYAEKEVKKEAFKQARDSVVGTASGGVTAGQALSGAEAPLYTAQGFAGNEAANAAVNAAATQAGGGLPSIAPSAATSGFDLSGIGSSGNYILPAAGAAGMFDLYKDKESRKKIGTGEGYLQGAASGAAMGSYFGPWGAAAGGVIGLGINAFGIGGESRTKVEEERRQALADQGITVPNYDQKEWELNEAFKGSRNEADLKGGDIENAAQFYGIQGYSGADQAKKEAIAQEAINQGLIREHHGTIDLSMTPEYQKYLEEQLAVPTSTGGGGGVDTRRMEAEAKKQRKKQVLASILPDITATPTKGPRYD